MEEGASAKPLEEHKSFEPAITYIRGSPYESRGLDLLRPGELAPTARSRTDNERLLQGNGGAKHDRESSAESSIDGGAKGTQGAAGPMLSAGAGSNVYTCEWCTFQGRFNDVVLHERTCSAKEGEKKGGEEGIGGSPALYSCEWKCGFKGIFDAITVHEKSCSLRSDRMGDPDGSMLKGFFQCNRKCGFQGSFEDVKSHERMCTSSTSVPPERPSQHATPEAPRRPAAAGEVLKKPTHTCALRCGFEGSFDDVLKHEKVCKPAPTHTCVNLCGFRGSYGAVAHHEETCPSRASQNSQTYASTATHTCKYLCGFRGSYDHVLSHEKTCSSASTPVTPASLASTHPLPTAAAAVAAVEEGLQARPVGIAYTCAFHCGFQGSYETVASHEVTCEKNAVSPQLGVEKALQSESGQGAPVEALLEEEGGATENGVGTYVDDSTEDLMTELDESMMSLWSPGRPRLVKFADDGYCVTAGSSVTPKGDSSGATASTPTGSAHFEASLLKLVNGAGIDSREEESMDREAEEAAASTAASLLGGSTARNAIIQRHMARKIAHSLQTSPLTPASVHVAPKGHASASSESPIRRSGPWRLQPALTDPFRPAADGDAALYQAPVGVSLQEEVLEEEEEGEEHETAVEGGGVRALECPIIAAGIGDADKGTAEVAPASTPPSRVSNGLETMDATIMASPSESSGDSQFGRTPSAGFAELLSSLKADNLRHRRSPVAANKEPHGVVEEAGVDGANRCGPPKLSVGFVDGEDDDHGGRRQVPGVKTVLDHRELLGEDKFQDMLRQLKEAQKSAAGHATQSPHEAAELQRSLKERAPTGGHGRRMGDTDMYDSLLSRRVVSRQKSDDVFEDVLARQSLNRDRRMRAMGQLDYLLEELCRATGFGYAEVWQRAHRKKEHAGGHGLLSEGRASLDMRGSLDAVRGFFERRINIISRRSSQDARRSFVDSRRFIAPSPGILKRRDLASNRNIASITEEDVYEDEEERRRARALLESRPSIVSQCWSLLFGGKAAHSSAQTSKDEPSTHRARRSSRDEHDDHGFDEHLDHRLRWAGEHVFLPELFEAGVGNSLIDSDWEEKLEQFVMCAQNKLSWYEKGKGFPGAAWAKKKVVYRDLYFLPDDDFEAGDPRVRMAKNLFDISCGIPVLHPDTGLLHAVIMLYRVRRQMEHRMNANWRHLHKHPGFRARIKSAASMAYWALAMEESVHHFEACRLGGKGGLHVAGVDVALDLEIEAGSRGSSFGPEAAHSSGLWTRAEHWLVKYFKKFKGVPEQKPTRGHSWGFCFWAAFGTLLSFYVIVGIESFFKRAYTFSGEELGFKQSGRYWPVVLINSFAAVCGMLFAAPTSPLIQPRMILGGHVIATACAVCVDYISNPVRGIALVPRWIATPLAPALGILIQSKVGLLHPPSCAAAVIFMEGEPEIKNMDWLYVVCPVLFDSVIVIVCAVLINNLSPDRSYPQFW